MAARFFARRTCKEASTVTQWEQPILKHKFEGHKKEIWGFVFLHDDIHIVSGSLDGTMRKWNCDTGLVVGKQWKGEGGGIYTLALSPDGKMIACGREDGSVQRWTTDGEMIQGVWTGHSSWVRSISWSPSGSHIASGSQDGTILIREARSGKVKVGPIMTKQIGVWSVAYSPSGDRIASGGFDKSICIWNAKTGKLVVGPIEHLGSWVTSLVWSSDSTKLYSASDKFARVFDTSSGETLILHRFKHDNSLYSIALSPDNNVLACVGVKGVARLWNTEPHQPLSQPIDQDRGDLYCVSFSQDGRYLACGGYDRKLTLWMVKDITPQRATHALQQSDRQIAHEETRSHLPSSSCLDADATRGGGFTEEAHDDSFFQSSQRSLPSPSPDFRLPPLFSVRRLWNIISRRHPVPEGDDSKDSRGKNFTFSPLYSSTRLADPPQPILRNHQHWNSSSVPVGFSRRPVDIAAFREEDRYAEAAAAMLRTNDNVANSSTRPSQPAVVSQRRLTQKQASTSEIEASCCGFVISCRRRSN